MAKNPLFSTYRQGENRVTSSMLAVFERIDLSLLETLLAAASGESALQMVSFANQPPGKGASIPDGRISAQFSYWFEVKTDRNVVRLQQLREHMSNLSEGPSDERLFVITPDAEQPQVIGELGDPRVVWFSFAALSDAIDAAVGDVTSAVSEHARFLLRELQALIVEDGLLYQDDVVVVAARDAYPFYLEESSYRCQAGRSFRDGIEYMAFYKDGCIQPEVPRILDLHDDVVATDEEIARRRAGGGSDLRIADVLDVSLRNEPHMRGKTWQIFLLSAADDPQTVRLPKPIRNDAVAASGRPTAWVQGQRYINLSRLTSPNVTATSDLAQPRDAR